MSRKPKDRRVRSRRTAKLATAAAVGAGAATAQGSIQFFDFDVTIGNGQTWYLEGPGGSTALADAAIRITSFPTGTFWHTTYSSSSWITTGWITLTYASFPSQAFNGFRLADQGQENPRILSTTQNVSAALFTGTGDGRNVSWYPNSSGNNANWDWNGWTIGTEDFAGFRFTHPTFGLVYGWVQVTILPDFNGVRLNTWAFEDNGGSIPVGAIPEPSTAGLAALAAGIVGLREYRRRRVKSKV